MKRWCVCVVLLCLLACRDPNSYQPTDPTLTDPPEPPVLVQPLDGWVSGDYDYPQFVDLSWQGVPGAQFYEILISSATWAYSGRVPHSSVTESIPFDGAYWWRVRAASSNWNNYTEWSSTFHFMLPNPHPPK